MQIGFLGDAFPAQVIFRLPQTGSYNTHLFNILAIKKKFLLIWYKAVLIIVFEAIRLEKACFLKSHYNLKIAYRFTSVQLTVFYNIAALKNRISSKLSFVNRRL